MGARTRMVEAATPNADGTANVLHAIREEIVRGLSLCAPGPEYFRTLVRILTRALDVEIGFAAEITDRAEPRRARSLAMSIDGNVIDGNEYWLDIGPCREVVRDHFCFHGDHVRDAYPRDSFFARQNVESYAGMALDDERGNLLGWLGIGSRSPLRDRENIRLALQMVAGRTAAELCREAEHKELMRRCMALETRLAVELQREIGGLDRSLAPETHDPLTRLPGRAIFVERLGRALADRERTLAVLLLDLDRFSLVNTSLGDEIGDRMLQRVALRLEACVLARGLVARPGADEFLILLENIGGRGEALRVAEAIDAVLAEPFLVHGSEVSTTASIGIVVSSGNYETPQHLLRDADTAMHRAKERGGARHEIFDHEMHARATERLQVETPLRRAVDREEFSLDYQPIVSLASGELRGFEALIRWHHPSRGVVAPGEFIPIAEETGMIIPIGNWVIGEACRQLGRWQAFAPMPLTISINVSARQIDESLPGILQNAAREAGLKPGQVFVEITETAIASERIAAVLGGIRELGFMVCIDDFGTGYSSLAYLVNLPIDVLKIDRVFVSAMNSVAAHEEMVRTILALAGNLHLDVIAEGVETRRQMGRLRELGSDCAQGFLFARPLSAPDATAMIAAGTTFRATLES